MKKQKAGFLNLPKRNRKIAKNDIIGTRNFALAITAFILNFSSRKYCTDSENLSFVLQPKSYYLNSTLQSEKIKVKKNNALQNTKDKLGLQHFFSDLKIYLILKPIQIALCIKLKVSLIKFLCMLERLDNDSTRISSSTSIQAIIYRMKAGQIKTSPDPVGSTLDSLVQMNMIEASPNNGNSQEKGQDLYYQLALTQYIACRSNAHINFLNQMICCLQTSQYIQFNVLLVSPSNRPSNPQVQKNSSQNNCQVCYTMLVKANSNPKYIEECRTYFSKSVEQIHGVLREFVNRYVLSVKLPYMILRLNQFLKDKNEQNQVKYEKKGAEKMEMEEEKQQNIQEIQNQELKNEPRKEQNINPNKLIN